MTITARVENREDTSLTRNLGPMAFLFKDERILAKHPLSCYPQGCLEGEKMKEKGGENQREEEKREN